MIAQRSIFLNSCGIGRINILPWHHTHLIRPLLGYSVEEQLLFSRSSVFLRHNFDEMLVREIYGALINHRTLIEFTVIRFPCWCGSNVWTGLNAHERSRFVHWPNFILLVTGQLNDINVCSSGTGCLEQRMLLGTWCFHVTATPIPFLESHSWIKLVLATYRFSRTLFRSLRSTNHIPYWKQLGFFIWCTGFQELSWRFYLNEAVFQNGVFNDDVGHLILF